MKTTRWMIKLVTLAAVAVPALNVAHGEPAPQTVVVMHRNIRNAQDEANWFELARGLSHEGFRVVSVAMEQNESATTMSAQVIKLLDEAGYNQRVLLVGTSSASDTLSAVAEAEPNRIEAVVYVSASDTVPTFGPRSVSVPAHLLGVVPTYQVKVTNEKYATAKAEGGATVFKVREQGHSTLGRTEDMVAMIDQVNSLAKKPVSVITGTK